jgi:hypothetical protein
MLNLEPQATNCEPYIPNPCIEPYMPVTVQGGWGRVGDSMDSWEMAEHGGIEEERTDSADAEERGELEKGEDFEGADGACINGGTEEGERTASPWTLGRRGR